MPEPEYVWLPREDILQFEEIERLVDVFLDLGVDKVRLTGGEPLLRRDLPSLVARLAARPRIRDLALTTNGVLLADHAEALALSGIVLQFNAQLRLIGDVDVGGAAGGSMDRLLPRTEMRAAVTRDYAVITPVEEVSSAPADRYRLPDRPVFGIFSSTTQPFCE